MKILKQQTHDPVLLVLIIKSVDVGKTVGMLDAFWNLSDIFIEFRDTLSDYLTWNRKASKSISLLHGEIKKLKTVGKSQSL